MKCRWFYSAHEKEKKTRKLNKQTKNVLNSLSYSTALVPNAGSNRVFDRSGCPRSGKKSGKKIFFQGQGIVWEF